MHAHQKLLQHLYSLCLIKMLSCRQVSLLLLTLQDCIRWINYLPCFVDTWLRKQMNVWMDRWKALRSDDVFSYWLKISWQQNQEGDHWSWEVQHSISNSHTMHIYLSYIQIHLGTQNRESKRGADAFTLVFVFIFVAFLFWVSFCSCLCLPLLNSPCL